MVFPIFFNQIVNPPNIKPKPNINVADKKKIRIVYILAVAKTDIPSKKYPTKNRKPIDNKPNTPPYIAYEVIIVNILVDVSKTDSSVPVFISSLKEVDVALIILHRKPHPIEPIRIYDIKSPPYEERAFIFPVLNILPKKIK
jgi:hypothetical protein